MKEQRRPRTIKSMMKRLNSEEPALVAMWQLRNVYKDDRNNSKKIRVAIRAEVGRIKARRKHNLLVAIGKKSGDNF